MNILSDIESIQEATCLAREDVHEKINQFAEKVGIMEQCGLNVMSQDETMQHIIDNRDQIMYDYENAIYIDESFKSTIKDVGATLIGVLVGAGFQYSSIKTPTGMLKLATLALFVGEEAAILTAALSVTSGAVIGGVIGHKIHKAVRNKKIGSEIIDDIKSVCNELTNTTNSPTEKDLTKLKSKTKQLIKTANYIIKTHKAQLPDKARSQMRPLITATEALDGITLTDTKTNKELLKNFMSIANDVVMSISGVTPEEIKAMNNKIQDIVDEVKEANEKSVKEQAEPTNNENTINESAVQEDDDDDDHLTESFIVNEKNAETQLATN